MVEDVPPAVVDLFEAVVVADVRRSSDPAIQTVLDAVWRIYDDLNECRLEGEHAL